MEELRAELDRYKETLGRYIKGLAVAKEALAQLNGADNRSFTSHHAQDAAKRIESILLPAPEMETVEITRYMCKTCGTMFRTQDVSSGGVCCWGGNTLVPLTGSYQRPKPQKVERSEVVGASYNTVQGHLVASLYVPTDAIGHPTTITVSWEG